MLLKAGGEKTPWAFWIVDNVSFGDGDETVRVCHCDCSSLCLRLVSRCFVRLVIFFSVIGGRGEKRRGGMGRLALFLAKFTIC